MVVLGSVFNSPNAIASFSQRWEGICSLPPSCHSAQTQYQKHIMPPSPGQFEWLFSGQCLIAQMHLPASHNGVKEFAPFLLHVTQHKPSIRNIFFHLHLTIKALQLGIDFLCSSLQIYLLLGNNAPVY